MNRLLWSKGPFELTLDLSQWVFGFNRYVERGYRCWNVFLGPVRLGRWQAT